MVSEAAAEQRRYPARGASETDVKCVKELLANHSQCVYQFRADDHDAQINDQPSFATLVATWDSARVPRQWDHRAHHRFPSVRSGKGGSIYSACTVQCTCVECDDGSPIGIVCESYRFGRARGLRPQVSACSQWKHHSTLRLCKTNTACNKDPCAPTPK